LPGLRNPDHLGCPFFPESGNWKDSGCVVNATSSSAPTFVVLGDSHASHLLPAFEQLSSRSGERGRLFAEGACPPLLEAVAVPAGDRFTRCTRMNTDTFELVN